MWRPVKEVAPFEILASWFDSSPIVARILGVSDLKWLERVLPSDARFQAVTGRLWWDCVASIQKRSISGTSIKGCERVLLIKNSLTV